jgi:CHAT domain-containing protein
MAMAIQPKDLPYTRLELLEVEENVPDTILIKLGAGDLPASVKNVLLHLSDVSIAHFACHGHQNMVNPLWSGLTLDDGEKLTVSQLMEKSMPKAALAFLSACETAMGDETLPDEALHIAASMLFVGFRGVVATMW